MTSEKPQIAGKDETIIPIESAVELAESSYRYESGRKKAIDEGRITMEELTIYKYINTWAVHNAPTMLNSKEQEKADDEAIEKAFLKAAEAFSISEEKAREIFYKVANISRVAK